MQLLNKIAVITGSGSGIGKLMAEKFAAEGAMVIIMDYSKHAADEVMHSIIGSGGKAAAIYVDVSQADEVKKAFEVVQSQFGGMHVLVNNAGIFPADDGSLLDITEDVWDRTININLKGLFLVCKYGIPLIKSSGGGSVVNMGSIVGLVGSTVPQDAYTASKGGVIALTRSLAVQLAKDHIRVNVICPGPIETPLLQHLIPTQEERDRRLVHIPHGRFGKAEDVVGAALYLASDQSAYVTGVTLPVDGGLTINYF